MSLPGSMTPPSFHLSDEEIKLLEQALQLAWDRFLKTVRMDQHNMLEAQQILAQRIMCSAAHGQRDPWRLARDALFHLWDVKFTGEPLIKIAPRKHRRSRRAS